MLDGLEPYLVLGPYLGLEPYLELDSYAITRHPSFSLRFLVILLFKSLLRYSRHDTMISRTSSLFIIQVIIYVFPRHNNVILVLLGTLHLTHDPAPSPQASLPPLPSSPTPPSPFPHYPCHQPHSRCHPHLKFTGSHHSFHPCTPQTTSNNHSNLNNNAVTSSNSNIDNANATDGNTSSSGTRAAQGLACIICAW